MIKFFRYINDRAVVLNFGESKKVQGKVLLHVFWINRQIKTKFFKTRFKLYKANKQTTTNKG